MDLSDNTHPVSIRGTSLGDFLTGGSAADTLVGGSGNDRLEGADGADSLDAASGADTLIGGNGDDVLRVGANEIGDDDLIDGGDGDDILTVTLANGAVTDATHIQGVETIDIGMRSTSSATFNATNVTGGTITASIGGRLTVVTTGSTPIGSKDIAVLDLTLDNDSDVDLSGQVNLGKVVLHGDTGGITNLGSISAVDVSDVANYSHVDFADGSGAVTVTGGIYTTFNFGTTLDSEDSVVGSADPDADTTVNATLEELDSLGGALHLDTITYLNATVEGANSLDLSDADSRYINLSTGLTPGSAVVVTGVNANTDQLHLEGDATLSYQANSASGMEVYSGGGNDTLRGGSAADSLDGGEGNDLLYGGSGATVLEGGDGNDTIVSGGSANILSFASNGDFNNDEGVDVVLNVSYTGEGVTGDSIVGPFYNVLGSRWDDTILGDAHDNWISGGWGSDSLNGGAGADTLLGGDGLNTLTGGAGADLFVLSVAARSDILDDPQGEPQPPTYIIMDFGTGDGIALEVASISSLVSGGASAVTTAFGVAADTSGVDTLLYADTDGDGQADLDPVITLQGGVKLANLALQGGKIVYKAASSGGNGGPGNTVDGVPVQTGSKDNGDGTSSTVITIPVVTPYRSESVGGNTVADIPLVTSGGSELLSAQLPTGYGLTVSGSAAPKTAGNSLTDLIREIRAHTDTGSSDQESLTGSGSGFLASLPTDTPLLVQTIVPSVAPGSAASPAEPLVIRGTPAAAGGPQTALVIDLRGLPSGTMIELQDVDFAAVIGAVSVTGGEGSQTVFGDSANQYIVLGADDDTLHGGGGDDHVGSHEGNDVLFGDDGADTVTGGLDNDIVYGNRQDDVVYGNQGMDTLFGGQDLDTLFGGQEGDVAYGNRSGDVIYGNRGADTLFGGQGNDALFGGQEGDSLFGNLGDDTLTGGLGADLFVFEAGGGADLVTDFRFAEGDRLVDAAGRGWTVADSASGAVVTFGDGASVTLAGLRAGQVTNGLFVAG